MFRILTLLLALMLYPLSAQAEKIGVLVPHEGRAFLDILVNEMKETSKKHSGLDLSFFNAKSSEEQELNQIKNWIEEGVDAIIMNPVSTKNSEEIHNLTAKAGIPLVYYNGMPPQKKFPGRVSIVSSNESVAGRLQARYLGSLVKGNGNVLILRGADELNAWARTNGAKTVLSTYPNLTIIEEVSANWSQDEAEKIVSKLLTSGKKIDVIIANNDMMALGAIDAFEKAGVPLDSVLIAGVDAVPQAIDGVKTGKMAVTILQNGRRQAQGSVENAVKMARGGFAQEFDWVPWEVVIPSNVADYAAK